MEDSLQTNDFLERLLRKTGGQYVIIAVIASQLVASIATLLGFISEQLNANYVTEIVLLLRTIGLVVIPIVTLLIVLIVFILSRSIRTKLDTWKKNPELLFDDANEEAWKASHSIIACT